MARHYRGRSELCRRGCRSHGQRTDFDRAGACRRQAFGNREPLVEILRWRSSGIPDSPRAWIIQTARNKAIDRIRRRSRQEATLHLFSAGAAPAVEEPDYDPSGIPDDRFRLIFTCCHPALALEAQIALTLRTLGGLETHEIARAFLVPEAAGLVALMLLHDSRRDSRLDEDGNLVLLEQQDRSRWDQRQIAEALPIVEQALRGGAGPFALQAAIAALHCQAARSEDTDWPQIVRLYDLLERLQPSPIVSLNRAAAVAMVEGPGLDDYHLLHAARADLLRRAGSFPEAARSYERALALVTNDSERRFLEGRLREVTTSSRSAS